MNRSSFIVALGLLLLASAVAWSAPTKQADPSTLPACQGCHDRNHDAATRADDGAKSGDQAQPAEPAKGKPQTLCPVMDRPINKEIYVDYQGKRIYFCCQGCISKFNQDPEKYLKKMRDRGEEPEDAPAAEPDK